jgi:NADH:ubiquinone oxidoreductase subunit 6 (subunit J)
MAIGFALGVVWAPNIVYSGFLLGGVFLSMAGLYLLLNADFVAAAQVLIYVGAVNVLILFAIMLVNRRYTFRSSEAGLAAQWGDGGGVFGAVCPPDGNGPEYPLAVGADPAHEQCFGDGWAFL